MAAAVPDAVQQFIAGFGDGDASILIPPPHKNSFSAAPRVHFYQSCDEGVPAELLYVQAHYGGTISVAREREGNIRKSWVLGITHGVEDVLKAMAEYATIKRSQAALALEYTRASERWQLADNFRQRLEEERISTQFPILVDRLTDAYLAGLFAADGSIGFYETKRGAFTLGSQIASAKIPILHAIQLVLGGSGCVSPKHERIVFGARDTERLCDAIRPHLIGAKVPQVDTAMNAQRLKLSRKTRKRSQKQREELQQMVQALKKMKRK